MDALRVALRHVASSCRLLRDDDGGALRPRSCVAGCRDRQQRWVSAAIFSTLQHSGSGGRTREQRRQSGRWQRRPNGDRLFGEATAARLTASGLAPGVIVVNNVLAHVCPAARPLMRQASAGIPQMPRPAGLRVRTGSRRRLWCSGLHHSAGLCRRRRRRRGR